MSKKTPQTTPKQNPEKPRDMATWLRDKYLHKSFAFVRDGHDWSGCSVSILEILSPTACRVARCCWVAAAFLQKKPLPRGWRAKFDELC